MALWDNDLSTNLSVYNITNITRGYQTYPFIYPNVFGSLTAVFALVAVTTNMLLILTFFVKRRLKHIHNVFITNLTVNDLLMGIVGIVSAIQYFTWRDNDIPLYLCQVTSALDKYAVTSSMYTLTLCSIDRYIFVIYPRRYREGSLSLHRSLFLLALIWTTAFLLSILPQFGNGFYGTSFVTNKCPFFITQETTYPLFYILISFPIPLCGMVYCYSQIFYMSMRKDDRGDLVNDRLNRMKSAFMFTLVSCVFIASVAVVHTYSFKSWITGVLPKTLNFAVGQLVFRLGAAVRPLIFIILDWECRYTIISMIPQKIRRTSSVDSTLSVNLATFNRSPRPSMGNMSVAGTVASGDSYYSRHLSVDKIPMRRISLVEGGRIIAEGSAAGLVRFDPNTVRLMRASPRPPKCKSACTTRW